MVISYFQSDSDIGVEVMFLMTNIFFIDLTVELDSYPDKQLIIVTSDKFCNVDNTPTNRNGNASSKVASRETIKVT